MEKSSGRGLNSDGNVIGSGSVHGDVDAGRTAPSNNGLVAVKLTKTYSPYNAGEVAGFPEGEAKRLVDTGYGEYHGEGDTAEAQRKLDEKSFATAARSQARAEQAQSRRQAREGHQTGAQPRGKGKAGKKGAKKDAIVPAKKAKSRKK